MQILISLAFQLDIDDDIVAMRTFQTIHEQRH